MSFFDSIPQPPPPPGPVRQPRPAWTQPDEIIPGSLSEVVMLIRTGQVAVAIGSVRAYPNGFEFTLHVRVHGNGGDENEPGWPDPFNIHRRGRQAADDGLRLGVMYADGRRGATTGGHWRPEEHDDPGRLVLQQGGSGASGRRWDGDFWVHPLPPEGPVTFVASWPEYGVAETRAELDGAAIRAAAGRGVTLWPEEPDPSPGGGYAASSLVIATDESDDPGPP